MKKPLCSRHSEIQISRDFGDSHTSAFFFVDSCAATRRSRYSKMITNCAACGAQLAHDAPHCGRCETKYCDATCQHDHWRRGHKQICKRIHRGGNAEQYHADKKYKEAVAVAVETCAEDPGATLDDWREAASTLEESARIARRVFGGEHPDVAKIEYDLQGARSYIGANNAPLPPPATRLEARLREAVAADAELGRDRQAPTALPSRAPDRAP